MGNLINPISVRLSVTSYWKSNWSVYNLFNYIYLFRQDQFIFSFLNWFFEKFYFFDNHFILSHYKCFRKNRFYYINFYYYFSKETQLNETSDTFFFSSLWQNSSIDSKKLLNKRFNYFYKILFTSLYWKLLLFIFTNYLTITKLPFVFNKSFFYFNVYSLNFFTITPDIIVRYVSLKLRQKHRLTWVLRPILKDLSWRVKSGLIGGYKILTAGRFTRKQIATYTWVKGGYLPLNQLTKLIKFNVTNIRLKYGVCGIKVWINYNNKFKLNSGFNNRILYPFYKPFSFLFLKKDFFLMIFLNRFFFIYLVYLIFFYIKNEVSQINLSKFYYILVKRYLLFLFINLFNQNTFLYTSFYIKWVSNFSLSIKLKKWIHLMFIFILKFYESVYTS